MTAATSRRAASSIAATRLVNKVLQIRRHLVGSLLKMVRAINKISISESDLGEGSHYYESSYVHNRPSIKIPWSMWFHAHGNAMTRVGLYHNLICHALLNYNQHLMSPCRKYVKFWMSVMNVQIASMLR